MADWIIAGQPSSILDPAVGPGIFPRVIAARLTAPTRMVCVDVDPNALIAMRRSLTAPSPLRVEGEGQLGDFLALRLEERFDAIIANPPYLRHHAMSYDFDVFARVGGAAGLSISRLSNSYILFLLRCATLLKPGGRMCFIIPAEWTNANFGQPVKEYLLDRGLLRRMAYFSHAADVFEDALTTSCVLFMESGPSDSATLPIHYVPANARLDGLASLDALAAAAPAMEVPKAALRVARKWDALIRGGTVAVPPGFVRLGDLASTKRGIATGANEFFHLSRQRAAAAGIMPQHLRACVGKAADVPGLVFTGNDFERLSRNGGRSHLVVFGRDLSEAERRYVAAGVAQGLPERHLLAVRSPWYGMEKRAPAPIWAAVFNRERLRFIHNRARVHNLTTFHGVFPHGLTDEQITALVALLNSPTVQRLAAGQVRVYGGGLRKFEPKDLLGILVPDVRAASSPTLSALASALGRLSSVRTGDADAMTDLDGLVETAATEACQAPRTLF